MVSVGDFKYFYLIKINKNTQKPRISLYLPPFHREISRTDVDELFYHFKFMLHQFLSSLSLKTWQKCKIWFLSLFLLQWTDNYCPMSIDKIEDILFNPNPNPSLSGCIRVFFMFVGRIHKLYVCIYYRQSL